MPSLLTIVLIVGLCVLAAISLLAQQEIARGLGRIADGVAWLSISYLLHDYNVRLGFLPNGWNLMPHLLMAAGLVFVLSGLRKFYRALNLPN